MNSRSSVVAISESWTFKSRSSDAANLWGADECWNLCMEASKFIFVEFLIHVIWLTLGYFVIIGNGSLWMIWALIWSFKVTKTDPEQRLRYLESFKWNLDQSNWEGEIKSFWVPSRIQTPVVQLRYLDHSFLLGSLLPTRPFKFVWKAGLKGYNYAWNRNFRVLIFTRSKCAHKQSCMLTIFSS